MSAEVPAAPPVPPPADRPARICAVCDAPLAGHYCHACGERRPELGDESLGPFLREQFREVTSADGRLWRTVRALFVPGRLTTEYFAGRRGLYLRPVRIFLVFNVLFFLTLTAIGANSVFQGRAASQRTALGYGGWATERLERAAERAGASQDVYDAAFDRRSEALASTLVGVMVPVFAAFLAIGLAWRRVAGVRHLVFATHYVAFAVAAALALGLGTFVLSRALQSGGIAVPSWLFSVDEAVSLVMLAYFVVGVRRVYALRWWQAVAVGVPVLGVGVIVATLVVRFVVTLWTVDVPA